MQAATPCVWIMTEYISLLLSQVLETKLKGHAFRISIVFNFPSDEIILRVGADEMNKLINELAGNSVHSFIVRQEGHDGLLSVCT